MKKAMPNKMMTKSAMPAKAKVTKKVVAKAPAKMMCKK